MISRSMTRRGALGMFAGTVARAGTLTLEELASHPTFSAHPAMQAGQTYGWNQSFIQSYRGGAAAFFQLADILRNAEKVT